MSSRMSMLRYVRPVHQMVVYMPVKRRVTSQHIQRLIEEINHDIIRMYEELKPLDMNVDIDMICYLDPNTNTIVCK